MSLSDFRSVSDRLMLDPAFLVRHILEERPWDRQVEIMNSVRDNYVTSVASCHAAGKSFIAARCVLWFLLAHGPDTIVITTAPTDRQVKGILWQEIRLAVNKLSRKVNLASMPLLQHWDLGKVSGDKWYATGFASKDYDTEAATGWHAENVLVVYDEAAGMSDDVIEGLTGCVSNPRTDRVLKIGNPTQPNSEFGREHTHAGGSFNISAFDTPNFTDAGIELKHIQDGSWEEMQPERERYPMLVTPGWVAEVLRKWGEESPLFIAKVLGQFPSEDSAGLFPLSLIEKCHLLHVEPVGAGILALDVARTGSDPSVLGLRRGMHYRKHREWRKLDLRALRQDVELIYGEVGAQALHIDSIGIGAGVADDMENAKDDNGQRLFNLVRVDFSTGSIKPDQHLNFRTDCYWHLRDLMQNQGIDLDPEDDDLTAQLLAITYGPHGNKQLIRITPKEILKRQIKRSIDDADCVVIAFAPVKPVRQNIFV